MTISTTGSRVSYNGNGVTTGFAFPFRFLENDDLVVELVGVSGVVTTLVLNTDYTVTGADEDAGGNVTMVVAPASGERLVIHRVVEATQEVDYISGDPFPAETHERALDKLTMLAQQNSEVATRAIVIPSYDPSNLTVELPSAASRANRLIGFDSLGNVVATVPSSDSSAALRVDLANGADPLNGAGLIGFDVGLPYAPGTVGAGVVDLTDEVINLSDELHALVVNVRDFGAKGDAVADDTAAFQAAVDHVKAARRGYVYVPPADAAKHYRITDQIVIDRAVGVVGAGENASIIYAEGLAADEAILAYDCDPADVVEHVEIARLTLRSNNHGPDGIRLNNVSYVRVRDVRLHDVYRGVTVHGTRCYSNTFDNMVGYGITYSTVRFIDHQGGGHHVFNACTFAGNYGFLIDAGSDTDGVALAGCNFEQCGANSLYVAGGVRGLTIIGCRTEGCNGTDFFIQPVSGKNVDGLAIIGNAFTSDDGALPPILFGGTGGDVRGFIVSGNHALNAAVGSYLVRLNGAGLAGEIVGNYIDSSTGVAVNAPQAGVEVRTNYNSAGAVPDYQGAYPMVSARAWCSFDGTTTGTHAPTAGANVATVERVSEGVYTITFGTAMPDANYVISGSVTNDGSASSLFNVVSKSAGGFQIQAVNGSGTALDPSNVSLVVTR